MRNLKQSELFILLAMKQKYFLFKICYSKAYYAIGVRKTD